MVNRLYDKGREKFAGAEINLGVGTGGDVIKAVLVDLGAYTPNFATDEFLSIIASGARIATSAAFTGKSKTAGVFNADGISYATVAAINPTVEALVIFKDTGNVATSALIAYIDSATGLPFQPNGGDVFIDWPTGPEKIFKL